MTVKIALAALVCALAGAVPAQARAWTFPGERLASNPLVEEALDVAYPYVELRGGRPCPRTDLTVLLADDLRVDDGDGDGRAILGGCTMWLDVELVRDAQDRTLMGDVRYWLCDTVTHELAHTAQSPLTPPMFVHSGEPFYEGGPPVEVLVKNGYRVPECETFGRDVNRRLRALNGRIARAERRRHFRRAGRSGSAGLRSRRAASRAG